ncbi:MAG: hypothetical protein EON93_21215, partial [Burkholderiales bacterium]
MLGDAMADAVDDWWIIGGAAVALYGAAPPQVKDVDVVLSVSDALRILPGLGVALTPGEADRRFRSDFYCQWNVPPVQVDFMAGFHAFDRLLIPATRLPVAIGGSTVFIPSREELVTILRHFGRPKD